MSITSKPSLNKGTRGRFIHLLDKVKNGEIKKVVNTPQIKSNGLKNNQWNNQGAATHYTLIETKKDKYKGTIILEPIVSGLYNDPSDGLRVPNSTSVSVKISAEKKDDCVRVKIGSFSAISSISYILISSIGNLPANFAPTSAKFINFEVGNGIFGYIFRDGSIRFTGPNLGPFAANQTISVNKTQFIYKNTLIPECGKGFILTPKDTWVSSSKLLVAKNNFPITIGLTNLTQTDFMATDYGEYYGLQFYDKKIYAATLNNSTNDLGLPSVIFNKVSESENQLNPSQVIIIGPTPTAVVITETCLALNPVNLLNMMATANYVDGSGAPPGSSLQQSFHSVTFDGGITWAPVDVYGQIASQVTAPPGFPILLEGSDNKAIFDKFGNLFVGIAAIYSSSDGSLLTVQEIIAWSSDGGLTFQLLYQTIGINPLSYGTDYPEIATGVEPDGSSVFWLVLKQDISFEEILYFGGELPQFATVCRFTGLGQFAGKRSMEIPGTENGGYGTVAVGPNGGVLVVGIPVNDKLGSLPNGNESIWWTYNPGGFNGQFQPNIKFVANSNTGYYAKYPPQPNRLTWTHPNVTIDKRGRWYLTYVDQTNSRIINGPTPNTYLIYSDDKGKHWSTPLLLNNDLRAPGAYHIMPQIALDQKTNDVVITWLDTREDLVGSATRLWAKVIHDGDLPHLKD